VVGKKGSEGRGFCEEVVATVENLGGESGGAAEVFGGSEWGSLGHLGAGFWNCVSTVQDWEKRMWERGSQCGKRYGTRETGMQVRMFKKTRV